jgi:hypothetical protein
VQQIDKPSEAVLPIILTSGRTIVRDRRCCEVGPFRRDQRSAAVGEHDQQQQDTTATRGADDLQNAALKRMPRAVDSYRTRKVAEMGSVWWRCSMRSTGSR